MGDPHFVEITKIKEETMGLRIIYGRAGTGKTSIVFNEIIKYSPSEMVCTPFFAEDKFCVDYIKTKLNLFVQNFENSCKDFEEVFDHLARPQVLSKPKALISKDVKKK